MVISVSDYDNKTVVPTMSAIIFENNFSHIFNKLMLDFVQLVNRLHSLWLSNTIINSSVFNLQAVHLQIELLFAVVSGDGEPALN